MKKIVFINLAVISLLIFSMFYNLFAENYVFTFEGKKYEIVKDKQTWVGAALKAAQKGGYLVHINSQAEQDTIWKAIMLGAKIPTDYTIVMDGGGIAYIWIGANDIAKEGEWIWDGDNDGKGINFWTGQGKNGKNDGQAINNSYVNWGGIQKNGVPSEPDNFGGRQNAAAIGLDPWPKDMGLFGQAGEWNDIDPANQLYYIIEYDETTSIEPNMDEKRCIGENCNISFSPNPFKDFISIQLNSEEFTTITIFDQFGKEVLNYPIMNHNFTIETVNLSTGVYLISLKNNNYVKNKILLKN